MAESNPLELHLIPRLRGGAGLAPATRSGCANAVRISLSLDKSAAIPSEYSNLTIYAGYLDHGRILIAKQPDIAGVHCKGTTIPSFISDIYFVQTSCGAAMD